MRILQKATNIIMRMIALASAATVHIGDALKLTSSGLVLCGQTDKPEFIAQADMTGDGTALCPVIPVGPEDVLEAELTTADSTQSPVLAVGKKLKTDTSINGLIPTVGGCCQVISFTGGAAGDIVTFRVTDADAAG